MRHRYRQILALLMGHSRREPMNSLLRTLPLSLYQLQNALRWQKGRRSFRPQSRQTQQVSQN